MENIINSKETIENKLNNLKENFKNLDVQEKDKNAIDYDIEYEIINNKLVNKQTGNSFKFTNQSEYEKVSNYVNNYIKNIMLEKLNLKCLWVPQIGVVTRNNYTKYLIKSDEIPQSDIYVSEDFFENSDKLLCLVQGTGNVRPGIWARSVCINDSLELGSMIPFVEKAYKHGMSVIIFNPNERRDPKSGKIIPEFKRMESHCLWVYQNIIKAFSKAKEIYFVSHSMGGYCTIDILNSFKDDLNQGLIKKIAFTDSVHGERFRVLDNETKINLVKNSINFVTSKLPAGNYISHYSRNYDCTYHFSAGHPKHEFTSGCSIDEIFKFFFDENYINNKLN